MGDCSGYRTIGYFTNWGIYGRKYPPQSIPVDKLTHILYAFAKNQEDGTVVLTDKWADQDIHYPGDTWESTGNDLFGNFKALNLLKQQNRNLKVLLSIGGWTFSNTQRLFDAPASTPEGRKQFAVSSVQLLKDFGLDGIDLDWEYPQNPEQGEHLILLLQEIRNHLDEYSESLESRVGEKPHFELTIASSASKSIYDNYHLDRLSGVVDFINLMAYDFAGSWESKSSHQANLYASSSNPGSTPFNIDDTVKGYIAAGTPADKIVLGMPLYGRAFASTTGLGEPFSGVGEGSWENGVWDFKALPQDGSEEIIDEEAGASYSYNGGTQTLVSYDNAEIAARKARYIKDNGLGGGMWWELSGDREGEESLIAVVHNELGDIQDKPNWISYVDSQFDNLKAGFQ